MSKSTVECVWKDSYDVAFAAKTESNEVNAPKNPIQPPIDLLEPIKPLSPMTWFTYAKKNVIGKSERIARNWPNTSDEVRKQFEKVYASVRDRR